MHPNRQFLAHAVVHMPLCLHDLFRVAPPLHSNGGGRGGEGTITSGMFPWGSEDTVARRRLLCKGGGGICFDMVFTLVSWPSISHIRFAVGERVPAPFMHVSSQCATKNIFTTVSCHHDGLTLLVMSRKGKATSQMRLAQAELLHLLLSDMRQRDDPQRFMLECRFPHEDQSWLAFEMSGLPVPRGP